MKKLITLFILGILLTSCKKEQRTDYTINGNATGIYNGIRVYLKNIDQKGNQVVKDSAVIMEEKFTMNGSVEEPGVYFLSLDGSLGSAIFMLENSEIEIELNKENIMESKVTGSKSNELCWKYQEGMKAISEEGNKVMVAYRQTLSTQDTIKRDSLSDELQKLGEKLQAYPLDFINENNDSYFALNLIGLETNKQQIDIPGFMDAFNNLTPKLKASNKGIELKQKLDKLYDDYKKIAHLEIGKIAPNFEAPDPDGKMVSLNDIKGKVTVIDFWAAWCGPCRRENPNVVRIYDQYHDQGLEIIGVSLDGERRQKEPKKVWLEAIEKDGLNWHQVSNLKYFNDPVAKLYNIKSIPATYILDAEGKIVAKNLRGKALENKIKELLDKS